MPRRRRHLSPEEKALWEQVAKTTERLHADKPSEPDAAPLPQPTPARDTFVQPPIPNFRVGAKVSAKRPHDIAPSIADGLRKAPLIMDHKTHKKMTGGKLKPDSRIDLHGMTVAEAHSELIAFLLTAHDIGHRLVLVITGKGKDRADGGPIPTRMGVLRHQVPQWMRLPPLNHVVMQVTPAHLKHGGHGAYYVYLRRRG